MNRPEHLSVPTELTIDGEAVAGEGTVLEVYDPATEQPVAAVPGADGRQVDLAIAAARRAFDEGPGRAPER